MGVVIRVATPPCAMVMAMCFIAMTVRPTSAGTAGNIEGCRMYGDMAWSIMVERQKPAPIADQLSVYANYEGDMRETWNWMVYKAYEQPLAATEAEKERAATEFSNQVTLTCLKQHT